jgi:hypothetical protein
LDHLGTLRLFERRSYNSVAKGRGHFFPVKALRETIGLCRNATESALPDECVTGALLPEQG